MKHSNCNLVLLLALLSCGKANVQTLEHMQKADALNIKKSDQSISAATPSGYSLTWEDNFDGTTLNPGNWFIGCKDPVSGHYIPGSAGDYLLNNSYAGYITPEDVSVQNGTLVLRGQKRTYHGTNPAGTYRYTNGWVASMHRVHLNKGYIEFRAKFPSGAKVWPALWLCAEDLVWGPEWDMFEYFGTKSGGIDLMGCHLMTGAYPNTHWYSYDVQSFDATYDCEAWHVYGFEWTADYAKWYVDGNVVRTLNASGVTEWPNEEMYVVLNNGQRSAASDGTTVWPNYLTIDYVRIYKKTNAVLPNGNFESGSFAPWSKYGNASILSNNQHTGSYCANISADNSGMEYVITGLKPNTRYTFRGYIKSLNGSQAFICVKDYGGNQVSTATSSISYSLLSVTFTTGSTNTSARLCFYRWDSGPGQACGDDFEIVE